MGNRAAKAAIIRDELPRFRSSIGRTESKRPPKPKVANGEKFIVRRDSHNKGPLELFRFILFKGFFENRFSIWLVISMEFAHYFYITAEAFKNKVIYIYFFCVNKRIFFW